MAVEKVKEYLRTYHMEERILDGSLTHHFYNFP